MPLIPSKFTLAGLTITTRIQNDLATTRQIVGEARFQAQEIVIDKTAAHKELTEQAFYHELVHWIMYLISADEEKCTEEFVDRFAHFLYQFEKTKEFSEGEWQFAEYKPTQKQENVELLDLAKNVHCLDQISSAELQRTLLSEV